MAVGTGGTFSADARSIGMDLNDVQQLTRTVNCRGDKGTAPYEFKGKKYGVKYEKKSNGDITLLSMSAL